MSEARSAFSLRSADLASDRAALIELWRGNLSIEGQHEAKYDWSYRDSPYGAPRVVLLHHASSGRPIGASAILPRRMRTGADVLLSGVRADLVVGAKFRTVFPALMLQREIRRIGLEQLDVLVGFPNPRAAGVFARIGYTRAAEMVRYARVLRSAEYLARIVPAALAGIASPAIDWPRHAALVMRHGVAGGFRAQWLDRPDERFDALWRRLAAHRAVLGVRDAEFLAWRFSSQPGHRYRLLVLADAARGDLAAYAVCEPVERALHVRDFIADPGVPGALEALLRELTLEAFGLGYASLSLEFCGPPEVVRALRAAGFRPRESRPVYLDISARWAEKLAGSDFYLTAADEDQ